MYIRKLNRNKGIVYRAEVSLDDGSKKSKTFRTAEEAKRWGRSEEDARQSQQDSGVTRVRMALDEYFEKFMTEYAQFHHSKGWLQSDRLMYRKYVQPILGLRSIREIQPLDIQKVLNEMRKQGLAESYANRLRQLLSKMFNEAVRTYRYLIFNPVSAVKPFKEVEKPIATLNREEAYRLLCWADDQPFGLGIHLALGLGLREGEVSGLMWDAVDLDQRTIAVRRKWQKKISELEEFVKGKKIRTLGIYPDELLERMKAQRGRFPQSGFVLCRPSGEMVSPMQLIQLLKNGIKAAGIKRVTFHGLRHTFASLYMQSGGDLYDLQKIMGHQDVSTTERYRHTDPEYLRKRCGLTDLYSKTELTQVSSAQIPPKKEKPALRRVSSLRSG